jgi:CheY-like chemotaxis protein/PAS domain-containing protein
MENEPWRLRDVARLLSLVETERRYYQDILASLPVGVAILNREFRPVSVNRAFRSALDWSHPNIENAELAEFLPTATLRTAAQTTLEQGSAHEEQVETGGGKILRFHLLPLREWDGSAEPELLITVEDISAPVEKAERSAESRSEPLGAIAWEVDPSTMRFMEVDTAAAQRLGLEPRHWQRGELFFSTRIHEGDLSRVKAFFQGLAHGHAARQCEYRAIDAGGGVRWLRDSILAEPERLRGATVDLTEQRRIDEMAAQAARIETQSAIASEMAHECNNLLMILSGYGEDLLQTLDEGDSRRTNVKEILKAGERLTRLSSRLAGFTLKQPEPQPRPVTLDPFLEQVREQLLAGAASTELVFLPGTERAVVHVDPERLAMCLRTLGRELSGPLQLATRNEGITSGSTRPGSRLAAGEYAVISLRGQGWLSPGARPFDLDLQADRESSELIAAYRFIQASGGDVEVSESGFDVFLQRIAAPAEPVIPAARETILVVDDEPSIRILMRKVLEREGYPVLEAGSGTEALEVAAAFQEPIPLLLTDVVMPGMSGVELAERLAAIRAETRILFVSGFTGETAISGSNLPRGFAYLQKPFSLPAFLAKVRETLDRPFARAQTAR